METILISSCLLGVPCRWHGKKTYLSSKIKALLNDKGLKIIAACPETLGGLPTPRPPVKRRGSRVFETCAEKANRKNVTGQERTAEFSKGAELTFALCQTHKIKKAILCLYSPSCDKNGLTGKYLIERGITVINTF